MCVVKKLLVTRNNRYNTLTNIDNQRVNVYVIYKTIIFWIMIILSDNKSIKIPHWLLNVWNDTSRKNGTSCIYFSKFGKHIWTFKIFTRFHTLRLPIPLKFSLCLKKSTLRKINNWYLERKVLWINMMRSLKIEL